MLFFIYSFIIVTGNFSLAERDNEVVDLLSIISQRLNIHSIYCTFSKIQFLKNGETEINNGELAYQNGNVYYSVTCYPYIDVDIREDNKQPDRPNNLFELFSKIWHEKNKANNDETEKDIRKRMDIIKASFYNGRFINCQSGFNYSTTPICVECYPYKEPDIRCYYIWIRRFNLLHLLGISWIPVGAGKYAYKRGEIYVSDELIPKKTKPLYNSLINSLREDAEKSYPSDFFKVYKRENYRILSYDYFTTFWFDINNNIVKIQQGPFYGGALCHVEELKRKYSGDITDFLEPSKFTYIYSDFKEFPNGIRIPLKIEYIMTSGSLTSQDPDSDRLMEKLVEVKNKYGYESKEFQEIQKEYLIKRALLKSKVTTICKDHIITYIHPESLKVNEPIPDEVFQIQIEENTPIYKGDSFEIVTSPDYKPYYYQGDKEEIKITSYLKKNVKSLLFALFGIGVVSLSIFFTKKYLGWRI